MKIENIIFDVDGVFTSGHFLYSEAGKVMKVFGPCDGDGIKFLQKYCEIRIAAISADHRGFKISEARMNDMGLSLSLVSEETRLHYFASNFDLQATAFMGDGIFDARILAQVAVGIAPSSATSQAKNAASYVTRHPGGEGAVAEACFWLGKNYFPDQFSMFIADNGFNEADF